MQISVTHKQKLYFCNNSDSQATIPNIKHLNECFYYRTEPRGGWTDLDNFETNILP